MTNPTPFQEPPDFSLVLDGPLYQLYRKTYLSGPILELVLRGIRCEASGRVLAQERL